VFGGLPLVAFAFSAGLGTFFAPCAYPLLPGYVSFYLGETTGDSGSVASADGGQQAPESPEFDGFGTGPLATRLADILALVVPARLAPRLVRAAAVGTVVSLGFFLVYGVLAGITAALGSQILGRISVLELVVGVILIVVGSAAALGYDLPTPTVRLPERRRSVGGFFGFGVLYAAAAAGCTAPIFVGIGVQAVAAGPAVAVATFSAYAAGMSLLMVAVTVASALGRETLLTRLAGRTDLIERVMGVLLVVAGAVQLYFFLFRFDGLRVLGLA
jgi:cytochrome c-type biogenesis protein